VFGGEYSVTYVSDNGCKCTVIYKFVCDEIIIKGKKEVATEKPSNFVIYPNPSNGNFTVKPNVTASTKEKVYQIKITDLSGKAVFSQQTIPLESNYQLDISQYNAGIYFLSITVGNSTEVKKLIKN
jgi:hypothetical protein